MPELPKIDILPDHWEIVRRILQKHVPQHAVWAFGSRAKWTAKQYSDLDLAIITDKPLSLDISASLSDDLSESDLPYKVDVVDWATTGESFRKIIERDRVVVQKGGRGWGMGSEYQPRFFGDLVDFVAEKTKAEHTSFTTYISTENMLSSFGGVTTAATLPGSGSVTRFKTGDTLFSNIRTYFKKVWQAEFDGHCSNDVLVFRPKDETVLCSNYLHYLCRWEKFTEFSVRTSKGAKMPRGDKDALAQFQFELPPIEEQITMAEVLRRLDNKITVNRRINQTLEAMAQAIFTSWFVDFDPVKVKIAAKAEGRDPLRAAMSAISGKADAELDSLPPEAFAQLAATAALFPDEMEESELGKIPREWRISKIETLLSRLSAKARYTKEQVSAYGQIPVFEQGASILLGYHNGVASYPASAESPMFIFGDHTCVTRLSFQPFDISQNVIPLQGKDRATAWVYYAVKEKQKFQEYRRHWMELISKDVAVATADICLEFSKRISKLQLHIEANERQMQSLRELRDTLLPKLLSGELSVENLSSNLEAMA